MIQNMKLLALDKKYWVLARRGVLLLSFEKETIDLSDSSSQIYYPYMWQNIIFQIYYNDAWKGFNLELLQEIDYSSMMQIQTFTQIDELEKVSHTVYNVLHFPVDDVSATSVIIETPIYDETNILDSFNMPEITVTTLVE